MQALTTCITGKIKAAGHLHTLSISILYGNGQTTYCLARPRWHCKGTQLASTRSNFISDLGKTHNCENTHGYALATAVGKLDFSSSVNFTATHWGKMLVILSAWWCATRSKFEM